MDAEELFPKRAEDPLAQLRKQDLDRFSVDELEERISELEAEIGRVRAKLDGAVSHLKAADSLFKR